MKSFNIHVQAEVSNVSQELDVASSVQALVKNLTIENLKLLAEKCKKPGINKKIQQYKKFM